MGVPPGASPPLVAGRDLHWPGFDVLPRNPSRRPVLGRSLRPPDMPPSGSLVVGGGADPGLLKLADVRRRGSPRDVRDVALLIDLPP
jgi:hypothetical protein